MVGARPCYLRGFDPMSLPDTGVHLADVATGARFKVARASENDLVETLVARLESRRTE